MQTYNGQEPTTLTASGIIIKSIPFYKAEIEKLNDEISTIISTIENSKEEESKRYNSMIRKGGTIIQSAFDASQFKHLQESLHESQGSERSSSQHKNDDDDNNSTSDLPNPQSNIPLLKNDQNKAKNESPLFASDEQSIATQGTDVETVDGKQSANLHSKKNEKTNSPIKSTLMKTAEGIKMSASAVQKGVQKTVNLAQGGAAISVQVATNLFLGSNDGQVRDGGFVTFSTLSAKAQCVQMIHHQKPFTFQVSDAPLPKAVFWNNVGMTHRKQQVGFITSQVLTGLLCLFWTIPVTFITSLAEVNSLKKEIPFLETATENYPWIETLLAQLNPILLVILKVLVSIILSKFSEREGHVSQNALNASVLTKLSIFLVS